MANLVGYENMFSEREDQSQNEWLSALSYLLKPSASCRHCAFSYHVDGCWNDAGEMFALWRYRWVNALGACELYFYTQTNRHHHHHQHGTITLQWNTEHKDHWLGRAFPLCDLHDTSCRQVKRELIKIRSVRVKRGGGLPSGFRWISVSVSDVQRWIMKPHSTTT